MNEIKISNSLNDFNRIYEDMKLQFPTRELKSYWHFEKLFEQGFYKMLFCEYGYMLVFQEKETNMLWLDYFAIFKNFHSKGYGSEMLKSLNFLFPDYKGCYIEVEKADVKEPNTLRRIKFYEKTGALNLNMDYYFPCVDNEPLPMELYFLPFKNVGIQKPDNKTILLSVKNVFNTLHTDVANLHDVLHRISCRAQSPQA